MPRYFLTHRLKVAAHSVSRAERRAGPRNRKTAESGEFPSAIKISHPAPIKRLSSNSDVIRLKENLQFLLL
jgi:hypothetical protein